MATYAAKTEVTSQKSRAEIEHTLERYGASQFAYMSQADKSMIGFVKDNTTIRFILPLPEKGAREFMLTPTGKRAAPNVAEAAYEQAVRQKWRALALVIKAKLEAIEAGISTFESEFFSNIVLPNGKTVFEQTIDQVRTTIDNGSVRPLLQLE
jgi:hypothetical protein